MSDNTQNIPDTAEKPSVTKNTSEKPVSTKTPHKKSHHRKKHTHWLNKLLVVFVLSTVGVGSYYGWKAVETTHQDLQQRLTNAEKQRTDLSVELKRVNTENTQQLNAFRGQQIQLQNNFATLLDRNINVRKDWILAEAEYLINLANHRLLLERDVVTAITALSNADTRLAQVGDPALITVRKQLAKDISALRAVAQPDVTGMALVLTALGSQVDDLPLVTPDPKTIKDQKQSQSSILESTDVTSIFGKIWQDLKGLVEIRDHAQAKPPLLAPEQRYFLTQNLQLKIEHARHALIHGDTKLFSELLNTSQAWLNEYFDTESTATQALLEQLAQLSKQDIKPKIPDISTSFHAISKYRADNTIESAP